jgi:hypothetical protein
MTKILELAPAFLTLVTGITYPHLIRAHSDGSAYSVVAPRHQDGGA